MFQSLVVTVQPGLRLIWQPKAPPWERSQEHPAVVDVDMSSSKLLHELIAKLSGAAKVGAGTAIQSLNDKSNSHCTALHPPNDLTLRSTRRVFPKKNKKTTLSLISS